MTIEYKKGLPDNTADDKIWIITEWDGSVTTLLLPEAY